MKQTFISKLHGKNGRLYINYGEIEYIENIGMVKITSFPINSQVQVNSSLLFISLLYTIHFTYIFIFNSYKSKSTFAYASLSLVNKLLSDWSKFWVL